MTTVEIGGTHVTVEDVVAVARNGASVGVAPAVPERLRKAREVLDRAAAGGQRIYGLNTGLGANLGTSVEGNAGEFQRQLLHGRSGAVGDPIPIEVVRATMFARASMLSRGGSGISPKVFNALVAALNAGVHPVMPGIGSIGAGDLILMTALARCLIGEGDAEFSGERLPAAEALARAGLVPVKLAPKDGLSLINASAVSAGSGALAVADALSAFGQQQQAAALTMEAMGANLTILDPHLQAARPDPGQAEAAAQLRTLLARDDQATPGTLQDPLSIRCIPSIHGALLDTIGQTRRAIEIELNAAADNPLVLADDGLVLSTGNFHTPALALAFETLGLAVAQAAAATAARFIQLTGSGRKGLPKYLSPVGGASAGFVPLQKTVTAILAAIRHRANPVMLDFLPVSEGVEDHATQTPLAIAKCAEMISLWRRLIAFELMAAAQAADLRGEANHHQRPSWADAAQNQWSLVPGTRTIHTAIRAHVSMLHEDRPLGADAETLYAALSSGKWQA